MIGPCGLQPFYINNHHCDHSCNIAKESPDNPGGRVARLGQISPPGGLLAVFNEKGFNKCDSVDPEASPRQHFNFLAFCAESLKAGGAQRAVRGRRPLILGTNWFAIH